MFTYNIYSFKYLCIYFSNLLIKHVINNFPICLFICFVLFLCFNNNFPIFSSYYYYFIIIIIKNNTKHWKLTNTLIFRAITAFL